jgi:integrase
MIIALGIYLLLRGSEATAIRIGDVDRAQGKIRVHVFKSKKTVWMPICAELDQELQSWLTWYAEWAQRALGRGLDDQWYLVPAKDPFRYELDPLTKKFTRQASAADLRPATRIQRVFDVAKTVLVAAGYPVTDPDGQPTWDGMHTLRRSGARALWESPAEPGLRPGHLPGPGDAAPQGPQDHPPLHRLRRGRGRTHAHPARPGHVPRRPAGCERG